MMTQSLFVKTENPVNAGPIPPAPFAKGEFTLIAVERHYPKLINYGRIK